LRGWPRKASISATTATVRMGLCSIFSAAVRGGSSSAVMSWNATTIDRAVRTRWPAGAEK
jgi:hypothetical protein